MGAHIPYPFHRWPRLGRAEARLLSWTARRLDLGTGSHTAAAELSALVGQEVECARSTIHLADPLSSGGRARLIIVIGPEAGETDLLLEVESALARHILHRALGGGGAFHPLPESRPLSATERGILAYIAARVLSSTAAPSMQILEVVSSAERVDSLLDATPIPFIRLDLRIGDHIGALRLFIPEPRRSRLDRRPPRPLPIGLHVDMTIELGHAHLPFSEIAAARPDDILIPDELFMAEAKLPPTLLRARTVGSSRTNFWIRVEPEGLRVHALEPSGLETGPYIEEIRKMPTTNASITTRLLETVGDATLEISVEIARVRISLEELAALSEDMVLLSGRPLLEPVVLRLGDRPWATGELVEVDGEVGIRLLDIGERGGGMELDPPFDDREPPTRVEAPRTS